MTKKILITGKGSYIGTSFIKWLKQWPDQYWVEELSVKGEDWKQKDFSEFDVVLHVAGLAHIKENKNNSSLFFKVNRDLAYQVALKAKQNGISQFILLSSMSVYGIDNGCIHNNTVPKPKSSYGASKLQAEKIISMMEERVFKVAIVRPPMVYGRECRGNYLKLSKIARVVPFFPDIKNVRSMIHIDNLTEYLRMLVDSQATGIYLPQNNEYVCTSNMVRNIARIHGKDIKMIRFMNPIIQLLVGRDKHVTKIFGDLTYEKNEIINSVRSFDESLLLTEEK